MLIHREDIYDKSPTKQGEADLIVAKHRNGPTANIPAVFQGHYSRFADMAKDVPESQSPAAFDSPRSDLE